MLKTTEWICMKVNTLCVDFVARPCGKMADSTDIKINQEFRTDIFSISKTYIINRILPGGRVTGRISGGVGGLHHIWQVSVSVMAPLLWGLFQ